MMGRYGMDASRSVGYNRHAWPWLIRGRPAGVTGWPKPEAVAEVACGNGSVMPSIVNVVEAR
jgi:hypothetical protein